MTASDSKRDARGLAQGVLSYARKNVRTIAVLLAALVFVWLLGEVSEGEIMTLDALAYRFFVVTLRSDVMTPIMEGFTSLSSVAVILVMPRARRRGAASAPTWQARSCSTRCSSSSCRGRGRTGTGWRWRAATAFPQGTR